MVNYKKFIFLALALVLLLSSVWTVMDIVISIIGKVPPAVSLETEYIEGRGWALRRGRQSLRSSISSDGLRRNGKLPSLAFKEKRILFLGESVCFSPFTMQGQDWPSIVEKHLRKSGVSVTTMNAGVPGYSMQNVRFAYPWFKDRFPIDLVVVYEGWNDFYLEKFDPDFEFEKSVKKIFPKWPFSLEPKIDYLKYDVPPPPPGILPILKPLRFLIDSSPAAAYIYSKLATKFSLQFVKNEHEFLLSSAETYMFYLARLINETKKDGIPIVILRPFSVFRDKNFTHPDLEKSLSALIDKLNREGIVIKSGEENKVLVLLREWIRQLDTIADKLAEKTHALVVDPSSEMFEKITPENATKGGLYYSYMATPYHTGAKGDNLLGSIVAKELLKVGLVEQIGQAPWIHPLENKKEDYDLKYRDISLKQFEFNRVFLAFLFAIMFSLIGGMFLVLVSDFEQFKNYFDWSISLGAITVLVLLSFLHQYINNPLWCLILTLIFLVLIPVCIIIKKRFLLGDAVKLFLLRVFLSGLVGLVLIFFASEIGIYILKNSQSAIKIIQEYLAWMDFQVRHSLFEKGELTFDMLYQKGDSIKRPLHLLYPLSLQERFYASGSPLLASAISMAIGADPLDVFVVLFGLTAAALTAPAIFICIKRIPILLELRSQLLKTCFLNLLLIFLCAASFFVGMFILIPATQNAAIAMAGMAFAIYFEGDIDKRSLIFLLSAGLAMLTPDPSVLISITGMVLVWGMTNSAKYNNRAELRKTALWVSGGLCLVIFGKSMMLTYPAAHPAVFEFLEKRNLVLPFNIFSQKLIAITYYLFAVITIGSLGYLLSRNSSLGFATVLMLIMAAAFFYHQELFKSIPLAASLTIVLSILSSNNSKGYNLLR